MSDAWSKWWFLRGGNIHPAWKYRRYSQIRDMAMDLPREAWKVSRAELFRSILKNLDEIGVDDTIDWIKSRGEFEIKELENPKAPTSE